MNLPPDSKDVFKRNMLDRYLARPNKSYKKGKFQILDNLCYAEFLCYYFLDCKAKTDNDDNDNFT